jgi:hypothetical protein
MTFYSLTDLPTLTFFDQDPEIQQILQDPVISNVLRDLQSNPQVFASAGKCLHRKSSTLLNFDFTGGTGCSQGPSHC